MDARLVVGTIGLVAILLAATGLAIDSERGGVHEHDLLPIQWGVTLDGTTTFTPAATGTGGVCVPACSPAETRIQATVEGPLPPGTQYTLTVGQHTLRFDGPSLDGVLAGDHRAASATLALEGQGVVATTRLSPEFSTPGTAVFSPGGTLQLEQIGAVEVSALIDSELPDAFAATPTAWIDDVALGEYTFENGVWVLDVRVERLALDELERFEVRLGGTPVLAADF